MYLNMWWIRILIVLLTYLMGNLHLSDVKIWKFSTNTKLGSNGHSHSQAKHSHLKLNNKSTIHYEPIALRGIGDKLHHDKRLCVLPFGAIKTIRDLRLNVKPGSCHYKTRIGFRQDGVNRENLVKIKRTSYHDPNIIIATVNIQSLKNKELQVSELFDDYAVDVLVLTETWLTNKESDKNWLDATDLNKGNTAIYVHTRSNGHGGGLALMCKSCCKTLKKGNTSSFEYTTWELTIKSRHITVSGFYHPPYSTITN